MQHRAGKLRQLLPGLALAAAATPGAPSALCRSGSYRHGKRCITDTLASKVMPGSRKEVEHPGELEVAAMISFPSQVAICREGSIGPFLSAGHHPEEVIEKN